MLCIVEIVQMFRLNYHGRKQSNKTIIEKFNLVIQVLFNSFLPGNTINYTRPLCNNLREM